ncbi:MAG: galactokinase, partial [Oscillospiraceae bacterium]
SERNLSSSLIRGIAAKFVKEKYKIGGFCAYTTSNVLKGSGLSSSAAFEVLVGTILNHLYNKGTVPAIAIAQYAQFAENVYFGKPSGLMDQMASSVGGMISIDFANVKKPLIKQVKFDFNALNCALCIVDTGGSHADLTDEYASIPDEMKSIAAMFTKPTLQGLTMDDLLQNIQPIRRKLGDRALLRAFHFLKENDRVDAIIAALGRSDYAAFKKIVIESGNSSFRFLQNVYANAVPREQG